jgi:GTPase SAR1 family protein
MAKVIVVCGFAGSGKSTFVSGFADKSLQDGTRTFIINLDPAVEGKLSCEPDIDIRDTVDYEQVMQDGDMGPNGAILTCLNLFLLEQMDTLAATLQENKDTYDYIIIDTPGQIEVFTWSAAGSLLTDMLSSIFSDVVLFYIVDSEASTGSIDTFLANMLHVCSIYCKMNVPLEIVWSKTDLVPEEVITEFLESCRQGSSVQEMNDNDPSMEPMFWEDIQEAFEEMYHEIPSRFASFGLFDE